jgi:hypothetical protein
MKQRGDKGEEKDKDEVVWPREDGTRVAVVSIRD